MIIPARQHLPDTATIPIPGDKSLSHRAAILAALSDTPVTLTGFLTAEDCLHTLACLRQLGVPIQREHQTVIIHGVGKHGLSPPESPLDTGNSGTAIRLLAGVLSAQPFTSHITGDASIQRRPMQRIITPLTHMGAQFETHTPPLIIHGQSLQGITYTLPVPSAQVKSAILLAGLFASGQTMITEPIPCRDHTERLLALFNSPVTRTGTTLILEPPDRICGPEHLAIPADISSALYFIVLALLCQKSWTFDAIGINPTRRAGLDYLLASQGLQIHPLSTVITEPIARIQTEPGGLKTAEISPAQIPNLIDDIPILSIATICAGQPFTIRHAAELRVKESDRIDSIVALAQALGAHCQTFPDGFHLDPPAVFQDFHYDCAADHRLAMTAIIAALATGVQGTITGTQSIATSFPTFFDNLNQLGIQYAKDY